MSESEDLIRFDVAYALAVLASPHYVFPLTLPRKLELGETASQILSDCIDPDSFKGSSCKIVEQPKMKYTLEVGADKLSLFPCGIIRAGGSGVAIQLYDTALKRSFALKVPRVSVLAYEGTDQKHLDSDRLIERFNLEFEAFDNERQISRLLSHENITRHFFGRGVELKGVGGKAVSTTLPFSVSEWIDGAQPLHTYLIEQKPDLKSLIALVSDSYSALAHVHAQNVIHWDIKSDNLLVSKNGVIKLIDFGNAKKLDQPLELSATTTKGKYPQIDALTPIDTKLDESRRFRIGMPNASWHNKFIDLWMLAQEWNRCLHFSPKFFSGISDLSDTEQTVLQATLEAQSSARNEEARECLNIIFDRILYPFCSPDDFSMFINRDRTFNSDALYYASAEHILEELSRITPPFGAAQDIPELLVSLDEIVRLPVTGNSVFTHRIASIVDSKIIQPTTLHYQLAQVRQVFPGATHTRFEHLLGTVTTAAYFIRSLYLNNTNSFWRISATKNDIRSVLLAAVLHDSGHLAFGHFIEEMDDLMSGLKHVDYIIQLLTNCIDALRGLETAENENFKITKEETDELVEIVKKYWCNETGRGGSDNEAIALFEQIISFFKPLDPTENISMHLTRKDTRRALNGILKSIVDGPMDADKLDYLRRDSLHTGVFFSSGIDLERFFESLRACVNISDHHASWQPGIGVSEKGIAPIETIITARYHLYSIVYWHRTVRGITALLQRLLSELSLQLSDNEWRSFIRLLINNFRRMEDREALEWLRGNLRERGLLDRKLDTESQAEGDGTTFSNVIDGLLGNHQRDFRMAFELGYMGPTSQNPSEGMLPRELLHESICREIHPDQKMAVKYRKRISQFRAELQKTFEAEVQKLTGETFLLDTILIDVPEPGKDQIKGLTVSQINKRSKKGVVLQHSGMETTKADYIDLILVSPIAATLTDVFKRWARKVRIFMTRDDLERLQKLQFEAGDVAALWEHILSSRYNINPNQTSLRLN